MSVQFTGSILIDSVDRSADFHSFVLTLTRRMALVPATFANPDEIPLPGAASGLLAVSFSYTESGSSGLWLALFSAYNSDAGTLPFQARLRPGAQSASNPTYAGTIVVNDLDIGGTPTQWKIQSKQWPVYGVTQAT